MEYFYTIKDVDILEKPTDEPKVYRTRPTVKGFIINEDGKIALLTVRGHYGLPGGGIEGDETKEEALLRECKEEIGCEVHIEKFLGTTLQYRAIPAKKYETHYFIARVVGEIGTPTTNQENELGVETVWCTKEEVEQKLTEQLQDDMEGDYPMQFNRRTHFEACKKFLEAMS